MGTNQHSETYDDKTRLLDIGHDTLCQNYMLEAMSEFGKALELSQKHIYQALPRLLSMWFDLTGVCVGRMEKDNSLQSSLQDSQEKANNLISHLIDKVQPCSFYTALPQLIAHICHQHEDTSTIVTSILKRVLEKYPRQAMWALAWLRHSACAVRSSMGDEIFKSTAKKFQRQENMDVHDLLMDSRSLFKYLIDLAKYKPVKDKTNSFSVKLWRGSSPLHAFVPPIKAALSVSHASIEANDRSKDIFPKQVPRMRAFHKDIQLMSSKARPKRITVFAVQPEYADTPAASYELSNQDVGEIHFLLKQEAKGDLRKDARVQDLNNVINRILAGAQSGAHVACQRRLHLRTFSVVCLSEDCGILEWVPNTDSFRNIVTKSYNPQAPRHSRRRRGTNLADFGYLRDAYEKAQQFYFKRGNLKKAALMFEKLCLQKYPPLLYWWFVHNFPNPHAWFEARARFTLSASVWSAVGHIIGLGDRHSENILIDTANGECVHVDFDCIFNKGLNLPRPEVIPFRLTVNMIGKTKLEND
uniref:non-specific serine/threonine protein kinase n=1 Tax=Corethron hystrix TaxID=216773 RepID=A0A7S1BX17_9STRA